MKSFKKNLIISVFACLNLVLGANAYLLWDINSGIKLYQDKRYIDSINFFNSYLNQNPSDSDGYYWLAKSYKENNLEEFSKNNFKKAYEMMVEKENIEKNLIDNDENQESFEDYFDMAVMYFESANYKEAMHYADIMLKMNSKSPSAYFIKAKILYVLGDIEGAKGNLNNAVLYDPNLLKTNLASVLKITQVPEASKDFYYGFTYEKYFEGDINSSLDYCRKYLELEPSNQDMLNFLVDLYIKNNDLNSARAAAEEIKEKYPNNINNLLMLSKIYKLENKKQEAKAIIDKAYKINPNKEETLSILGQYYFENEDYKKAQSIFKTLIEINDSDLNAYYSYIYSLIQLNRSDDALLGIRKLNKLQIKNSMLDFLTSRICLLEGEFENAQEYMESAIQKDKNKIYYFEKAKIDYILGEYMQSIKDLDEIKNARYENVAQEEVQRLYFQNYIRLKDIENAKKYINVNNNLDKKTIVYKYDLYVLYKLQGDIKKENELKAQLKKAKPSTVRDYVILSDFKKDISSTEQIKTKEENPAFKLLDEANKRFGDTFEIILQKNILKNSEK